MKPARRAFASAMLASASVAGCLRFGYEQLGDDELPGTAGGSGGTSSRGGSAGASPTGGAPLRGGAAGAPGAEGGAGLAEQAGAGGDSASGGVADSGGSSGDGGSGGGGGADGSGATGSGGASGAGDGCLQLLADEAAFAAVLPSFVTTVEDFTLDRDGNPVTDFIVTPGDDFLYYEELTFDSFATSDQQPLGTRTARVVANRGVSIESRIPSFSGYDGIDSNFVAPQSLVGLRAQSTGPTDFILGVVRSDAAEVATYAVPIATGVFTLGVHSTCGPIISSVELSPERVPGGPHESVHWIMTEVEFAP